MQKVSRLDPSFPVIKITNISKGHDDPGFQGVIDQAIDVLASDGAVYQRGSELVHVVRRTPSKFMRADSTAVLRSGAPMIRPLRQVTLFARLVAGALWQTWSQKDNAWKDTTPGDKICLGVLQAGEWHGVRTLVAVTSSPYIKPNGELVQAPGYDKDTGVLFAPTDTFKLVSNEVEDLTIDHARAALGRLKDLVADFPFATTADCSAWLAALLTLVGRHLVNGCVPAFAIDAATRGSGKTYLGKILHLIAYGSDPACISAPEREEEWKKLITSLLSEGDPMLFLDNIGRKLTSPTLDSALTSTEWKDRTLGGTLITNTPNRSTWVFTGNNLRFGGDLARRTIMIRLESPHENPEDRDDFKRKNILGHVAHFRHEYLHDALLVLRAYAVATGTPKGKPWGGFDSWAYAIPPVLEWLGEPSPLTKKATATEDGDESREILKAFIAVMPAEPMTARDLVEKSYREHGPASPLQVIIEQITRSPTGKRPDHLKLGYWLRANRGRAVESKRITSQKGADHTLLWVVGGIEGQTIPLPQPPVTAP